jgi:chromosome partitioning protein
LEWEAALKTIAVIARKGGSGKTTVAVHLALAAHLRGLSTVMADTDPQRSTTEVLKARQGDGPLCVGATGAELIAIQRRHERDGAQVMVIDTPAGSERDIAHAIALANLSILVIRPTFLDLAASIQTAQILRGLRKPGLILLNQAPVTRGGIEPPAVKRAIEALQLMRLPVIPVVLRSRVVYQTALATGRSAEEIDPGSAGSQDIVQAWRFIERFAIGDQSAAKSA